MNKIDHNFIKECDQLIKIGQGKQVLELIQAIPTKIIPRKYLSQIGTLLNRCGGSYYCLKLLHSFIRGSYYDLGTNEDKKTYAKALIDIGAQNEGLNLINEFNLEHDPSILLTKVFCYFKSWDYKKALPLMLKYINLIDDEYMRLVGTINLSSIYIFLEKHDLALNILIDLDKNIGNKHLLLKGYVLEQLGQIYFQQSKFKQSKLALTKSSNILKASNQKALLYPQKWLALLELKTTGSTKLLTKVRSKNKFFNDFETLRDLDFWQGRITENKELTNFVFYSTPFKEFKIRIPQVNIKQSWGWQPNAKKQIWDIFGDRLPVSRELTSQLFCHLISDGYKPMNLGSIHSKLFPDEYYNPHSSPDRIYQIISRLNKKMDTVFNYKVEKEHGFYNIDPRKIKNFNFNIKFDQAYLLSQPRDILLMQLKSLFLKSDFTAKELSLKFNITQRTANRWILELTNKNDIKRFGQGRNTRYKVA